MNEEYLTSQQVADILGCTRTYVTILVRRGSFPGARKFDPTRKNSALSIPKKSVDAFLEKQIVTPEIQTEVSSEN